MEAGTVVCKNGIKMTVESIFPSAEWCLCTWFDGEGTELHRDNCLVESLIIVSRPEDRGDE
jgi:uncharacterized protein YodC (DUF2158 family)